MSIQRTRVVKMTFDYCDSPDMLCTTKQELIKPLTDEEIFAISNTMPYANRFEFAKAIEKAHGIK